MDIKRNKRIKVGKISLVLFLTIIISLLILNASKSKAISPVPSIAQSNVIRGDVPAETPPPSIKAEAFLPPRLPGTDSFSLPFPSSTSGVNSLSSSSATPFSTRVDTTRANSSTTTPSPVILPSGPTQGSNPISTIRSLPDLPTSTPESIKKSTLKEVIKYPSTPTMSPIPEPTIPPPFDLDLPVRPHRQLTDDWCDPAVIQSWTEFDLGKKYDSQSFQKATWDWELGHNMGFSLADWHASPYAVASALHHYQPALAFADHVYSTVGGADRAIALSIADPEVRQPVIALIYNGDHYILVHGLRADKNPYLYPDATIMGFYITDPFVGRDLSLGFDTYIPISTWHSFIFNRCIHGARGDSWENRYVIIKEE